MKLEDLEFLRLLPEFMQEDEANIALSKAVDEIIQPLAARLKLLSTWGYIDVLPEDELDELAWELDIQWYYLANRGDLETKRRLIRESDITHSHLGTPWAAEETIRAFFGSATVQEWNEYDGEPGHFRIATESLELFYKERDKFLRILELVKRKSAWYDGELLEINKVAPLYTGAFTTLDISSMTEAFVPNVDYTSQAVGYTGAFTVLDICYMTDALSLDIDFKTHANAYASALLYEEIEMHVSAKED